MTEVVVFDDLFLMPSFWVQGFLTLEARGQIRLRWARGTKSPISHDVKKWKSVAFIAKRSSRERLGYIDIFDNFESIDLPTLGRVDAYFKFNFNAAYIAASIEPELVTRIHPIGFYFPVQLETGMAAKVAALRAARAGWYAAAVDLKQRAKNARDAMRQRQDLDSRHLPISDYVARLPAIQERVLDLFWNVGYWAERFDADRVTAKTRVELMRVLQRIDRDGKYRMRFGFVDKPDARAEVPDLVLTPSPNTRDYLETVARSHIGIASRGLSKCFSWRIGEHLAMRRFVFLERFFNTSRVPVEDGKHAVFFESDLSDFADKLRWYLEHAAERERIAAAGGDYFAMHCAPDRQIAGMLETLLG